MANSEYEKLIAECLAEMEAVPPMTSPVKDTLSTCIALAPCRVELFFKFIKQPSPH